MAPKYIISALKDKDPENLTTITQVYRARATYRLSKREIVGVTSTKLTFSVVFAYLEHEREENFTWALEKLKELFTWDKFLPDVVNVSMKCNDYVKSERQEHVMDQWNNIMYSNIEDEYDVHLKHFESVCGDIPAFVKYVNETWLVPYKERFVAAWTNKVTHLGNTATNRYSVVFVSLSMKLNNTFFPLLIAPPMYTSRHTIIAIVFVNNNHWVQIKLKPDCPLPPVTPRWRQNCSDDAKAWESAYAGRFKYWEELCHS
ncbi:uncharacterized protein LOC131629037 [Vicia villosa]|uniref:uncharacterized protein LOC131629037 n=1 Tax=Vicia villosa TaxID=3911 RepID=UPI00273B1C33|nr:uncharacterized protein LOC131629037 [Vicia villosa]